MCVLCHGICVTCCSCPLFQEPGTRPNLTWPAVSAGVWPENVYTCTHTRAHMQTQAPEEQSNRTHTLPQASREEGSKGWWSHSTPTVNLSHSATSPVTRTPLVTSTLQNYWVCSCRAACTLSIRQILLYNYTTGEFLNLNSVFSTFHSFRVNKAKMSRKFSDKLLTLNCWCVWITSQ